MVIPLVRLRSLQNLQHLDFSLKLSATEHLNKKFLIYAMKLM